MANTIKEYDGFLATVRKETGIEAFSADDGGLMLNFVDFGSNAYKELNVAARLHLLGAGIRLLGGLGAPVNETLREIRDVFENLNGEIENRMGNEVLVEQKDIS